MPDSIPIPNGKVNPSPQQDEGKAKSSHSIHPSTAAAVTTLYLASSAAEGNISTFIQAHAEAVKQQSKPLKELKKSRKSTRLKSSSKQSHAASAGNGGNQIAQSAKLRSELAAKASNAFIEQIRREEHLVKTEISLCKYVGTLHSNLQEKWAAYQASPHIVEFKAFMEAAIEMYSPTSTQGKLAQELIDQAQNANNDQQNWLNESSIKRLVTGQHGNPHAWSAFTNAAVKDIGKIVGFPAKSSDVVTLALDSFVQMINNNVRNLALQLQFLQTYEQIASHKGGSIVKMQALMGIMMQIGIAANEESSQRNQTLSNFSIMSLKNTQHEIEKSIYEQKLNQEKHHGLLGWFEDFFKSIGEVIMRICNLVSHVFTGDFKDAGQEIEKLTGINKIYDAIKKMIAIETSALRLEKSKRELKI